MAPPPPPPPPRTADVGAPPPATVRRSSSKGVTDADAAPQLPAPPFAAGWALLVYLLATLALAYPALSGAWLVAQHSDQYIAGYAFREYAAASLRSGGGFPQWNPFLFGGL